MLISLFSTKTPYYPLQISSILSLNSFLGIKSLFNSKEYKYFFIFITSKIIPLFLILLSLSYYFFFQNISNLNLKENTFIVLGLSFFGFSWSFIKDKIKFNEILIILIIGPYLLTSFLLHSGLFTDRSRELRETMEFVSSLDIVQNKTINVDKSGINNSESQSKIIRISLMTPKLGEGFKNIEDMHEAELAWSTDSNAKTIINNSYEVIYENESLKPWKLILKK